MRAAASGQPRSVALFGHASTACDVVRAAASIHSWDAHSVPPLQPSFSKLHALLLSTCHADSDSLDADSVPDWAAPFLPTVFASCSAFAADSDSLDAGSTPDWSAPSFQSA